MMDRGDRLRSTAVGVLDRLGGSRSSAGVKPVRDGALVRDLGWREPRDSGHAVRHANSCRRFRSDQRSMEALRDDLTTHSGAARGFTGGEARVTVWAEPTPRESGAPG